MARYMGEQDRLFRTVVTKTFKDGSTRTTYHGPFTAKGAATSVANAESAVFMRKTHDGWGWHSPYTLMTVVESADPEWAVHE